MSSGTFSTDLVFFFGVGGSNPVTEHEQTVPACIKSAFPRQEILKFAWFLLII